MSHWCHTHRSSIARVARRWARRALSLRCTHTRASELSLRTYAYDARATTAGGWVALKYASSSIQPRLSRVRARPRQHEAPPALNTRRLFVVESFYYVRSIHVLTPTPSPPRPAIHQTPLLPPRLPSTTQADAYTHNQNPHDTTDKNTTNTTTNHSHTQKQKSVTDHG